MLQRVKSTLPLSIAIGVLAFIWVEVSMNFTFHWVTNGDLGIGLELPANLHLVAPAAFVTWGFFFAAGADMKAFRSLLIASLVGSVGALVLMILGPAVADLPDFWGISLVVGVVAFLVVLGSAVGPWYYVPGMFGAFASVVFWWVATGLDGWAENGGGVGSGLASLGKPETAGSGAFSGVLSTPYEWVFVSTLVSLLCGCVLGLVSVKFAGVLTRTPAAPEASESMA